MEHAREVGQVLEIDEVSQSEYFPLRVTKELEPDTEKGILKAEFAIGRQLWLVSIRHQLTHTLNALHKHRWTLLSPPDGLEWFTSDDPVVKLNFNSSGQYDFKGGWASSGTYIFMPLGPQHLLFTEVGKKPPTRGTVVSQEMATRIRQFIAEHAHRTIFAAAPDSEAIQLRPRIVDKEAVHAESLQWQRWHEEQSTVERQLMG